MNTVENRAPTFRTKVLRSVYASAAAAVLATSFVSSASAGDIVKITFCNETPRTIFTAIAYQKDVFVSAGWLTVPVGGCASFGGRYRLSDFYFRGETDPYPSGGGTAKSVWMSDSDKKFLIQDDNFDFENADLAKGNRNTKFEAFSEFLAMGGLPVTRANPEDTEAKIIFKAGGQLVQDAHPITYPATFESFSYPAIARPEVPRGEAR